MRENITYVSWSWVTQCSVFSCGYSLVSLNTAVSVLISFFGIPSGFRRVAGAVKQFLRYSAVRTHNTTNPQLYLWTYPQKISSVGGLLKFVIIFFLCNRRKSYIAVMFNNTSNLLLQTMLYLAQTDNITFPLNYTADANNVILEGDSE